MAIATPPSTTLVQPLLAEIGLIAEQAPWELHRWAEAPSDRPETYGALVKEAAAISMALESLIGSSGERLSACELARELNDYLIRIVLVRVPLEAALDRPETDIRFWLETVARPATMHLEALTHALHRAIVQLDE